MDDVLFKNCLNITLKYEGGYVNNPADHGGATNFGITQAVYDDWNQHHGLPAVDVKWITPTEVEAIYRNKYWIVGSCMYFPRHLACFHFDTCVNHGPTAAAKMLQKALNIAADGDIGPKTIKRANELEEPLAINFYAKNRELFYKAIIDDNPSQMVFYNGWMNRIAKLREGCWHV